MTEEITEDTKEKRLTPDEWSECRAMYELGQARTPELSEKFGVSKSAISKHFKINKVEYGSRKAEHDATVAKTVTAASAAKTATAVASFESSRKQKIEETKTEAYNDSRMIAQLTRKTIVETARAGASLASVQGELKTLRMASAIFEQTRQTRYAILNAEKDIDVATFPTLPMQDLTADEISALQAPPADMLDGPDIPLPELDEDDEDIVETT